MLTVAIPKRNKLQNIIVLTPKDGVSFILVSYTGLEEMYYVPFRHVEKFWRRMEEGGRKSFTYDEVDKAFRVRAFREFFVHYLEAMQRDLELRED